MIEVYEDHAFEIARRVLKSYRKDDTEPDEETVVDLGKRIHDAAAGIANEEIQHVIDNPSGPNMPVYPPVWAHGGD